MGYKKAKMPPFMKDITGWSAQQGVAARESIAGIKATAKKTAEGEKARIAAMRGRRFSNVTGPMGLEGPRWGQTPGVLPVMKKKKRGPSGEAFEFGIA